MKSLKTTLYAIALLLFITSCNNNENNNKFTIEGYLKNVPDSTKLQLRIDNKLIDSALVINEHFSFKGQIDSTKRAHIAMFSIREQFNLWIENGEIKIEGTSPGLYNNAQIIGGQTQNESNILKDRSANITDKIVALGQKYDKAESIETKDSLYEIISVYRKDEDEVIKGFIKEFPNSLVSLESLKNNYLRWDKNESISLFNSFTQSIQNSVNGKSIIEKISKITPTSIGDKFVDFQQKDPNGNTIKLSDVMGKNYTLIEFWGSWCAPCRKQNPYLVKLYKQYNSKGFEIVGVATEFKKENWLKAIEKDSLPWVNVSDIKGDNEVAIKYNVPGYPYNILLDGNGNIIAKKLTYTQLKNKISSLLPE